MYKMLLRKTLKFLLVVLVITGAWLVVWSRLMAGDVVRVQSSINHHYQALRAQGQAVSLKVDAVYATGFPFGFAVAVDGLTLSMVSGDETFAVEVPHLTLEPTSPLHGEYRVRLPTTFEALYAKNGAAPEHYTVTANALPAVRLRARNAKKQCGPFVGMACDTLPEGAPLISFAAQMPQAISLHMELNGEARDASFPFPNMDLPVYRAIPADISRDLWLFVSVLREALVYKTNG